ncbi:MAG: DUF1932 domain-containing protein [Acidimicrobiales bacterium]|nr:DUF1932 domain-containing protein [Acidimicrobiales bacterium]
MTIGMLHPGAMGASIGAVLRQKGVDTRWVDADRSPDSRRRAEDADLTAVESIDELAATCDVIISVCPPAAALAVAGAVAECGYDGCFLDANAVAPATARQIGDVVAAGGASTVDGGIVGPPVAHKGLTVLYLSGDPADTATIETLFADTALDSYIAGTEPGAASAVKMSFAAWSKGTSALLLAIRALAETEGVIDGLEHAWSVLTPDLIERAPATARATAPKAWRFVGEMGEIAASFEAAGLPGGFHRAAADVYAAMADLRDVDGAELGDVIARLTAG